MMVLTIETMTMTDDRLLEKFVRYRIVELFHSKDTP